MEIKDEERKVYIATKKIPFFIKFGSWIAERKTKKEMLVPKILAWYPKSAISSAVLESLITHNDKEVPDRLLQLIRIQISALVGCSFCIDLNSSDTKKNNITSEELDSILQKSELKSVTSFSEKEILAIEYTRMLTNTPVEINLEVQSKVKNLFSPREIVIIGTTISQVNYWARLIKGFGVTTACPINK